MACPRPRARGTAGVARPLLLAGGKRLRPAFCHWGFVGAGGDPDDPMVGRRRCRLRAAARLRALPRRRDGRLGHASRASAPPTSCSPTHHEPARVARRGPTLRRRRGHPGRRPGVRLRRPADVRRRAPRRGRSGTSCASSSTSASTSTSWAARAAARDPPRPSRIGRYKSRQVHHRAAAAPRRGAGRAGRPTSCCPRCRLRPAAGRRVPAPRRRAGRVRRRSASPGKPVGDDLREGKPTPLLASPATADAGRRREVLARVGTPDLSRRRGRRAHQADHRHRGASPSSRPPSRRSPPRRVAAPRASPARRRARDELVDAGRLRQPAGEAVADQAGREEGDRLVEGAVEHAQLGDDGLQPRRPPARGDGDRARRAPECSSARRAKPGRSRAAERPATARAARTGRAWGASSSANGEAGGRRRRDAAPTAPGRRTARRRAPAAGGRRRSSAPRRRRARGPRRWHGPRSASADVGVAQQRSRPSSRRPSARWSSPWPVKSSASTGPGHAGGPRRHGRRGAARRGRAAAAAAAVRRSRRGGGAARAGSGCGGAGDGAVMRQEVEHHVGHHAGLLDVHEVARRRRALSSRPCGGSNGRTSCRAGCPSPSAPAGRPAHPGTACPARAAVAVHSGRQGPKPPKRIDGSSFQRQPSASSRAPTLTR